MGRWRIAICDDIPEARDELTKAITGCSLLWRDGTEIYPFPSGKTFLKAIESGVFYDFIFMDVRMPEVSGIDAISALPPDYDAAVVFVTSYTDNWPNISNFTEAGYLVKPYTQETFNATINVMLGRRQKAHYFEYTSVESDIDDSFVYKRDTINCNRIMYFLASNHNIEMYTTNAKLRLSGVNLKDISTELAEHGFYQSHRSCLLNLRYYYDRTNRKVVIKTSGGTVTIPLSRDKIAAIEDAVMDYKTRGNYAF
jgi:DNA-binding LytR/AlgR family response regulator